MSGSAGVACVNIFDWFSHNSDRSVASLNVVDLVQVSGGGDPEQGSGWWLQKRRSGTAFDYQGRYEYEAVFGHGDAGDGSSAWLWQQDGGKRKKLSPELLSNLSSSKTGCVWISTSGR